MLVSFAVCEIVCYTAAYPELVPRPPRVSLLAISPILSIVCQLLVNMAFQLFAWTYTRQQPWLVYFMTNDAFSFFYDSCFVQRKMGIFFAIALTIHINVVQELVCMAAYGCLDINTAYCTFHESICGASSKYQKHLIIIIITIMFEASLLLFCCHLWLV